MLHDLSKRFRDDQLVRIVDAATIYMCACPAAVAHEVMRLREVYEYQQNCLSDGALMEQVLTANDNKVDAMLRRCIPTRGSCSWTNRPQHSALRRPSASSRRSGMSRVPASLSSSSATTCPTCSPSPIEFRS